LNRDLRVLIALVGLSLLVAFGLSAPSCHPDRRPPPARALGTGSEGEEPPSTSLGVTVGDATKAVESARADTAPTAPTSAPSPSAPPPPPTVRPASPGSYAVVEVKDGGTLQGTCRIAAGGPGVWTMDIFKDNDKGCGEKERATERMIVGDDRRLANCVVFLRGIRKGKDFPESMKSSDRTFLVDQKGCKYVPHVGWLRVGTQVVIGNSDGAEHNIHSYFETPADTVFNVTSAPFSKVDDTGAALLDKPGTYILKCDIHPWMSGNLFVVVHPYYAVTGSDGAWALTDVPAGDYELACWHEGMKETVTIQGGVPKMVAYSKDYVTTRPVSVKAGGSTTEDFEVPAEAGKK
jgi:plastocyanin